VPRAEKEAPPVSAVVEEEGMTGADEVVLDEGVDCWVADCCVAGSNVLSLAAGF